MWRKQEYLHAASSLRERLSSAVPVILIPRNQVLDDANPSLQPCRISWYIFEWGKVEEQVYVAVALGYGSIYNHSFQPNATFRLESPDAIEFVALRQIEANEEITLNYNGQPDDNDPVEFYPME